MNLEVAPCFEPITEYSLRWSQGLHEELGEEKVSILREEAVRDNFEDDVAEYDPEFVTFYNHGTKNALVGNDERPLMDSRNVGLLKGREMYTMCCLAASNLGAEAYRKGCRAWWGYTEPFSFTTTDEDIFYQLSKMGAILRRKKGLSWEECVSQVREAYDEKIEELQNSGGNPWTLISLVNDRDCLVCWTDANPPPTDCSWRKLGIALLGSAGHRMQRSQMLAIIAFYASWGYGLHDFGHQVYQLKGTVFSLEGGYVGFFLMLLASMVIIREHVKWLGKS